ncbi:tail fiber protein, partial [Glaesserella parasuis]
MAGLNEIAKWEREVYQIEEDDPVLGGVKGVTNKPLKHLANRTLYLKQVLEAAGQKLMPKKLTATTRNIADSTGHTHEIDLASTTTKGLVQLTNDTGLDSESLALTAKAGKAIAQSVAQLQLSTTNALNQKVNKTDISNAVNSTSQTTVASSQAVKTAYDLANSKYTAQDASPTQKGLVQLANNLTTND